MARLGPILGSVSWLMVLGLVACAAEERPMGTGIATNVSLDPSGATEPSTGSATGTTDGQGTVTSTSDTTSGGSTTGDDPIFDIPQPDAPDTGQDGCTKIDFVFSIDNSCSTEDDQATLQTVFPQFIQLIRENVQGQDYHIIVVDSDGDPTWACTMGGAESCCPDFTPGSYTFDTCDVTLGAGVHEPHGGNASNVDCGMPDDRRYMVGDDANLEDLFSCVAQVGTSGSFSEFPFEGAVRALENPMGCNEGFLRDDAILVMTVISDDHDGDFSYPGDAEMGDPNAWYQRIVAAKNGNEDATVMIGLTSYHCIMPPVAPFAQIVELFGDQGIQGSHCTAEEMHDAFELAVSTISTTCDEFIPG